MAPKFVRRERIYKPEYGSGLYYIEASRILESFAVVQCFYGSQLVGVLLNELCKSNQELPAFEAWCLRMSESFVGPGHGRPYFHSPDGLVSLMCCCNS